VEGSGLSERGLAESELSESWLLESSCPKGLQPHESCGVHRIGVEGVESWAEVLNRGMQRFNNHNDVEVAAAQ
jgi:hypothetical protein